MRTIRTDIPCTNPKTRYHFIASSNASAQQAKKDLEQRYGHVSLNKADTVIALGGDGTLLMTLRKMALYQQKHPTEPIKKAYGMNLGTLGAWMNPYQPDKLSELIHQAQGYFVKPLSVKIEKENHQTAEDIAFNEVTMSRSSMQVPEIEVSVNQSVVDKIKGDTVICSTPLGSRAYYSAAGGAVIPPEAPYLGLQSLGAYQAQDSILKPYHFNQLVPNSVSVNFKNISADKHRSVYVSCDRNMFKRVRNVEMKQNNALTVLLLKEKQKSLM